MATDVSFWFIIDPQRHYHLISDLHQNRLNRSLSCLITNWGIFKSYCSSTHPNNVQQKVSAEPKLSWWGSPSTRQAWLWGWGASGIARKAWDRTTTLWSFWGRTSSAWEPSATRVGGCLRIVCSLAPHRLWDSTSSARDPPRPVASAGWGPRWEKLLSCVNKIFIEICSTLSN